MFISKKEYERKLRRAYAKGRREAIREMELGERLDCMNRNLYQAIDGVESRLNHRIDGALRTTKININETKSNVCEKCSC